LKKKLIIIDLKKNFQNKISDTEYIKLNHGDLNYENNCKEIKFDINDIFKKKKKNIINFFNNLLFKMNEFNFHQDPLENEIFNLRHDKSNFIERILILTSLKKFNKNKSIDCKLFTDDLVSSKLIKLNFKNIEIIYLGTEKSIKIFSPYLSLLNYFVKLILITFFFKINNKSKIKLNKTLNFTFYPHFFENSSTKLYKNKFLNLNFLLGDETQSGFNLSSLFKVQKDINKKLNIYPIEKKIKYFELFKVFFKNIIEIYKFKKIIKYKFKFEKIIINNLFINQFQLCFLNRLKLNYYDKSIKDITSNGIIKRINYYMFEYSFGFYLANLLNNHNKNIKKFGFQHGIYTKKLMWFDIVRFHKNKLPDYIVCNQISSKKAYSKIIPMNKIFFKKNFEFDEKIYKKITKNDSNNLLFFLGLHDFNDNFDYIKNLLKNKKNKKRYFFLKLHPKTKKIPENLNNIFKNLKIVKKIDYNKKYKIFISQSSSMLYRFKENRISCNKIPYKYKINIF
jgi:hypothetical protein